MLAKNEDDDIVAKCEECAKYLEDEDGFLDDLSEYNKSQAKSDKTYEERAKSMHFVQILAEEKSILLQASAIIRKYVY